MECLIETALLTHGLKSLTNEEIQEMWTDKSENIVWVSGGRIIIGGIEQYLEFRKRAGELIRVDCGILGRALKEGLSGALTASGTMKVCQKLGIPMAVTCGMGGIGDIKGEELCPDLPALANLPVSLISTGPKDMLYRKETISWLAGHGVVVLGAERNYCTGYLFIGERVELQGVYKGEKKPPLLIINEIAEEKRVKDSKVLEEAVCEGKRALQEGRYYHPAANGKIDELTQGYSSRIQLESLLKNARFAEKC